ncbi:MAG: carboxypeptidase-like regulatory domain-containing protein, partial [Planctomycetes bacterium]|nr:carboxypeptidase-like regulatory domain-containing protein [Planctomycetota bacterium]
QSLETGAAKEITTNSRGEYDFLALPPGGYRMTILARGFATLIAQGTQRRIQKDRQDRGFSRGQPFGVLQWQGG